jgi:hypothetical protein
MKSWLKRKIRNLIWWAEDDRYEDEVVSIDESHNHRGIFFNSDYREFRIFKADNGHIVEVYNYRWHKDGENKLYIIRSENDIGQELAKILTLEELKAQ